MTRTYSFSAIEILNFMHRAERPRWRVGAVQPLGDDDDSPFLGERCRTPLRLQLVLTASSQPACGPPILLMLLPHSTYTTLTP